MGVVEVLVKCRNALVHGLRNNDDTCSVEPIAAWIYAGLERIVRTGFGVALL